MEELKPYVANHHSFCTLKSNFVSFIGAMKSLVEKRFGRSPFPPSLNTLQYFSRHCISLYAYLFSLTAVAVSNITHLIMCSGVKFSTSFLCRLMEKCAVQTPSNLPPSAPLTPNMATIAETLLTAIEEARGHLIPEDYHFYINSLLNFKATQQ